MKRWLLVIGLMLASLGGWAQTTSFYTDRAVATTPVGPGAVAVLVPIPYGQVRVCNFVASPTSPCTGPATITDIFGTPLMVVGGNFGQLTTDVVGRFMFGCASGTTYTVQVAPSGSNTPQVSYPITCSPNFTLANLLPTNNSWTGVNSFLNLNGILWIGGSAGFTTINGCLAALPVAGGFCATVPGYSESVGSNIVMTKNQHLLVFAPAAISLGNNSVTAAHGADGASIVGLAGEGFFGNSLGVQLTYTGTGSALSFGDNTGNLFDIRLEGFDVKLNTNSATAKALSLNSVQASTFVRLGLNGSNNAGQQGLAIDGTFNFAGDNSFDSIFINGFPIGTNWDHNTNNNLFKNLSIGNVSAGGTGINIVSGNGNVVDTADIESVGGGGAAVHCGNSTNNFGNRIAIYGQGNSSDYLIDTNCNGNVFDNLGATAGSQIITTGTGGTNNVVVNRYKNVVSSIGGITNGIGLSNGIPQLYSNTFGVLALDNSAHIRIRSGSILGWSPFVGDPSNTADDLGMGRDGPAVLDFGDGSSNTSTAARLQAAGIIFKGTTFTASGCTNSTLTGGATAGQMKIGQNTNCSVTVTMGNSATAPNGWTCSVWDETTPAPTLTPRQTAHAATTVTFNMTVNTNDFVTFVCQGW